MIDDKELFDLALEKFGVEHEIDITIGEIGEFLTCIGRKAQNRLQIDEIIDEIADVLICMNQMARIYGWEKVKERIKVKMKKKLAHVKKAIVSPKDECRGCFWGDFTEPKACRDCGRKQPDRFLQRTEKRG